MGAKSKEQGLKKRIKDGTLTREDVARRLAELAFGQANDCVKLVLGDDVKLDDLDLSLLTELKRKDKGTLEVRWVDRLRALEQLAQASGQDDHLAVCGRASATLLRRMRTAASLSSPSGAAVLRTLRTTVAEVSSPSALLRRRLTTRTGAGLSVSIREPSTVEPAFSGTAATSAICSPAGTAPAS